MQNDNKKKANTNKKFTDSERSIRWGAKNVSLKTLEVAGIPFCYNPNTLCAVLLFDGRRRISSVQKALNCKNLDNLIIIRSKAFIESFLKNGDSSNDEKGTESDEVKSNVFGFGLTINRLYGESFPAVEIARIIEEFKLVSLKKLNAYILKERPDLFPELTQHHVYYSKILSNFKSIDRLEEINETLKDGISQILGAKKHLADNVFEQRNQSQSPTDDNFVATAEDQEYINKLALQDLEEQEHLRDLSDETFDNLSGRYW